MYVTGEGKGNLLSYEAATQRLCFPKIGEVNEVGKTPPVKITNLYPKLREEYNDIFQGIDKLKCAKLKLHIDDTVQSVQDRHRIIQYHIKSRKNLKNRSNFTSYRKWRTLRPRSNLTSYRKWRTLRPRR